MEPTELLGRAHVAAIWRPLLSMGPKEGTALLVHSALRCNGASGIVGLSEGLERRLGCYGWGSHLGWVVWG